MTLNPRMKRDKLLAAAEGYLTLELPERALEAVESIEPRYRPKFEFNFLTGEAFRLLHRYRDALDAFHQAYQVNSKHIGLLFGMAWCFKRTDQLPLAIQAMEEAHDLHKEEPVILYNLACYWALAGNKSMALSWLGRALRKKSDLRKLIAAETDFDSIRDDPDFAILVNLSSQKADST